MATMQVKLKEQAYASNLKSRALSVLIYLIDRSNQELTCFPAIPTMAEQLHISISTVKRALRELVEAGYICKDTRYREKNRGQSSNLYTLILQNEKTAREKKDCSESGEGVGQALENDFNANGKDGHVKDGKNVDILKMASKEEDAEHISFERILSEQKAVQETVLEEYQSEILEAALKQGDSSNMRENRVCNIPNHCAYRGDNFGLSFCYDKSSQSKDKGAICMRFSVLAVNGGGGQFDIPLNYPIKI